MKNLIIISILVLTLFLACNKKTETQEQITSNTFSETIERDITADDIEVSAKQEAEIFKIMYVNSPEGLRVRNSQA